MAPSPCWLRRMLGYDVVEGDLGWFGHCWESGNLKQPLVSACDGCCWGATGAESAKSGTQFPLASLPPPFYFLFSLCLYLDHRLKHTNGSLREVHKKNPVSGLRKVKRLFCSLQKVKAHDQLSDAARLFALFSVLSFLSSCIPLLGLWRRRPSVAIGYTSISVVRRSQGCLCIMSTVDLQHVFNCMNTCARVMPIILYDGSIFKSVG